MTAEPEKYRFVLLSAVIISVDCIFNSIVGSSTLVNPISNGCSVRMVGITTAHYWSAILRKIRRQVGLSQSGLADLLRTDQPTVSRWERRLFVPSPAFQRLIESIAGDLGVATLHDMAAVVMHSPFPMLLVSQDMRVIAASASSGFALDRTTVEQTPEEERAYLETFSQEVAASGFWEQRIEKLDYEFCVGDERRKAVLVPVVMQGAVYALVQKAW